jgi:hypothetical protein
MTRYASNDVPPTDAELGENEDYESDLIKRDFAIGAASTEFDAGELAEVAFTHFEAIAEFGSDAEAVGKIIIQARKKWIADRASIAVYGRTGMINANEVKV